MRRTPAIALAAPTVVAWAVLWWWTVAPVGAQFDHAQLDRPSSRLAFTLVGWVVMAIAMMLPMLGLSTWHDEVHSADLTVFTLGYLAVWTMVGMAMVTADLAVHAIVSPSADLSTGAIALAGAYQLSARKQRCLARWRQPAAWDTNGADRWCAFDAGARQGWRSAGCCWSLMLLTFALGLRQFGWMLAIAAIMLFESRVGRADRWARVAGVALIAGATLRSVGA